MRAHAQGPKAAILGDYRARGRAGRIFAQRFTARDFDGKTGVICRSISCLFSKHLIGPTAPLSYTQPTASLCRVDLTQGT